MANQMLNTKEDSKQAIRCYAITPIDQLTLDKEQSRCLIKWIGGDFYDEEYFGEYLYITELENAIKTLKPKQEKVLRLRLAKFTLKQVGKFLELSLGRIRQLETDSLRKLRKETNIIDQIKIKYLCEAEELRESYNWQYELDGQMKTVTLHYSRCKICGLRNDEPTPDKRCPAKY